MPYSFKSNARKTLYLKFFLLKMDNKNRPMTDIEKNDIKLLFHEKVNIFNKNMYVTLIMFYMV